MERIQCAPDGGSVYAGYADSLVVSPNGAHAIELLYVGEPPRGDSFHSIGIDGRSLPGYAWGGSFVFSPCSRYVVFDWMAQRFERRTLVADMDAGRYFVLPHYIHRSGIAWPAITGFELGSGIGEPTEPLRYTFTGSEQWLDY
jgi:hypothetical protein